MVNIPFVPENIQTEADIKTFFVWLVSDQHLNFHPDTSFENYVDYETDERIYTDEEARQLNTLMDKCFEIKKDVHEIGIKVFKEYGIS
jgi:hypothetical protein